MFINHHWLLFRAKNFIDLMGNIMLPSMFVTSTCRRSWPNFKSFLQNSLFFRRLIFSSVKNILWSEFFLVQMNIIFSSFMFFDSQFSQFGIRLNYLKFYFFHHFFVHFSKLRIFLFWCSSLFFLWHWCRLYFFIILLILFVHPTS